MKNMLKNHGFTLVEILVVVVIIGILAAIIFTNITVVKRSRDAQRKSDIKKIQTALEQYKADFGSYPIVDSGISEPKIPENCGSSFGNDACTIIYLSKIPKDPSSWYNSGNYFYESINGSSYQLRACVENTKDPDRLVISAKCPDLFAGPGRFYILTNP